MKKGSNLSVKADGQEARKDRKSGTGMNGSPKKGGRGGKFTWDGAGGYSDAELRQIRPAAAAVDAKDPNYEEADQAEA